MSEVSYAQLDEVLRTLGFSSRADKKALVYRHKETGALIVLPASTAEENVLLHHLGTVRMTLDSYGIADPLDLASRLKEPVEVRQMHLSPTL